MKHPLEFAQKISLGYTNLCKPLCHELRLPQTAFDILMFLANNPEYETARDIVEIRRIKANLVSVNVDRLVKEGYLRREHAEEDRRKTRLLCTQKAELIIEKGRALQAAFFGSLLDGISPEQRTEVFETLDRVEENLDRMLNTAVKQ